MKNWKSVLSLALLAAFAVSASPALAKKTYSDSELRSLFRKSSKRERKLITSNSVHYWAWAKNEAADYVGDYLGPTGIVIGDPHPRNVFDYRSGGKAHLAVADIDDGGEAPLFLDIVRYVTYLETLDIKMKIGDSFDAYVAGLRGEKVDEPAALAEARKSSQKDIEEAHLKYIRKHTKNGKLDLDDLKLTGLAELTAKQKKTADALSRIALKRTGLEEVLDVGFKVNDSGSSADMERYWLLLGDGREAKLLLEFKELPESAVAYYQSQNGTASRVAKVVNAYSQSGLDEDKFGVVSANGVDFWMRPRHYQALDLDDEELSGKDQKEFAQYLANWMGRCQRDQAGGKKLLKLIEEDEKAAKNALEEMVRAYLEVITKM